MASSSSASSSRGRTNTDFFDNEVHLNVLLNSLQVSDQFQVTRLLSEIKNKNVAGVANEHLNKLYGLFHASGVFPYALPRGEVALEISETETLAKVRSAERIRLYRRYFDRPPVCVSNIGCPPGRPYMLSRVQNYGTHQQVEIADVSLNETGGFTVSVHSAGGNDVSIKMFVYAPKAPDRWWGERDIRFDSFLMKAVYHFTFAFAKDGKERLYDFVCPANERTPYLEFNSTSACKINVTHLRSIDNPVAAYLEYNDEDEDERRIRVLMVALNPPTRGGPHLRWMSEESATYDEFPRDDPYDAYVVEASVRSLNMPRWSFEGHYGFPNRGYPTLLFYLVINLRTKGARLIYAKLGGEESPLCQACTRELEVLAEAYPRAARQHFAQLVKFRRKPEYLAVLEKGDSIVTFPQEGGRTRVARSRFIYHRDPVKDLHVVPNDRIWEDGYTSSEEDYGTDEE